MAWLDGHRTPTVMLALAPASGTGLVGMGSADLSLALYLARIDVDWGLPDSAALHWFFLCLALYLPGFMPALPALSGLGSGSPCLTGYWLGSGLCWTESGLLGLHKLQHPNPDHGLIYLAL